MTLTEEQRLAIEIALRYIPQWPSTRKERWIREALQAMIDSSEHFTGATKLIGFDLERARGLRDFLQDDCAEVGDVWAEMIAEIERLRARDRQAAAAIVAMAEGAKQHVLKTHTIMKNVFDEADSLAGYCEELENIVITKDARIKELEAQLTITNVALENATRKPNVVYITGTGALGPDAGIASSDHIVEADQTVGGRRCHI